MSTKTLLTSEDLWKIVADGSRYELSHGELVPMIPIGIRHGQIVIRFGRRLDQYVQEKDLGIVCTEVGFRLTMNPDTVRAPDIAFIATRRFPEGRIPEKFADFPPDLAVEVLSPSDTVSELLRKIEEYFRAGVPLVWVVDPATQTVTVYRSLQNVKILSTDEELDGDGVLPGFRVKVGGVFAR
jgi:Uma2 family endonuclease